MLPKRKDEHLMTRLTPDAALGKFYRLHKEAKIKVLYLAAYDFSFLKANTIFIKSTDVLP